MLVLSGFGSKLFLSGADNNAPFSKLLHYPVKIPALGIETALDSNSKFWAGIFKSQSLATRVQELEQENALLKIDAAKTNAIQDQLDQVRKLNNLAKPLANTKIWVTVIGFDPYLHRMILNGGANRGIKANHAVICSTGLLGIVKSVDKTTSIIELISSPSLRIGAMLMDKQYTGGLIKGQGGSVMKLGMMERNVSVPAGTQVVTSVHSVEIPAWIPIGRVISQKSAPEFGTQELSVQFNITFGSIKDVAVLL